MTWVCHSAFGEDRYVELNHQHQPVQIIIRRGLTLNAGDVVKAKITAFNQTLRGYFAMAEDGIVFLPTPQSLTEREEVFVQITKEARQDKEATGKIVSGPETQVLMPEATEIPESEMDEIVAEAMSSRVVFGQGACLNIERTRVCWTIDVDSGKSDLPLWEINQLALDEIRRQITLKNMGGLILIDFAGSKKLLRTKMKEIPFDSMSSVHGWTKSGLFEVERRRERASLWDSCADNNPVAVYYQVRRAMAHHPVGEIFVAPEVLKLLSMQGIKAHPVFDMPISYFDIREKKK